MTTNIGAVYRHTKTGSLYIVTGLAIDKSFAASVRSDAPEHFIVLYRKFETTGPIGPVYARPEREFHEVGMWWDVEKDKEGGSTTMTVTSLEPVPRFQLQGAR